MKYMKAMIEAVELKAEDVILTSSCDADETCSDDCLWDGFECEFFA